MWPIFGGRALQYGTKKLQGTKLHLKLKKLHAIFRLRYFAVWNKTSGQDLEEKRRTK